MFNQGKKVQIQIEIYRFFKKVQVYIFISQKCSYVLQLYYNWRSFFLIETQIQIAVLHNWFKPQSFQVLYEKMHTIVLGGPHHSECELSLAVGDFRNNCLQRIKSDSRRVASVNKSTMPTQFSSVYNEIIELL